MSGDSPDLNVTGMTRRRWLLTTAFLVVVAALASGLVGAKVGKQYERNRLCCQTPRGRNIALSLRETLGLTSFHSQIGQDKWVLETVFPGVVNGFFVDVGSADGTLASNTKALEEQGWAGLCIDPFPTNMEGRACQMLKEVVFSEPGKALEFQVSDELSGIRDTLGVWKDRALKGQTVVFKTTTLAEILARTNAPKFIHFISLDIEGAELEALKGFPFDRYAVGALAVEHNDEEPKRSQIHALMKSRGYRRSHSWQQDDFYVRATDAGDSQGPLP
jgi:FkbM family methyltransferase